MHNTESGPQHLGWFGSGIETIIVLAWDRPCSQNVSGIMLCCLPCTELVEQDYLFSRLLFEPSTLTTHQVEEPVPRKCDLFEMPDISQPLPARQAARKATDKLQEIAKQEMVAVQGQGPRIEGGSSSSPPSGILTAEVGIQATVSVAVGPSRVEGGGSEYIPPPLELMRSAKESTVVPGYTNAQVSEFRKIIGKDGSVKCPIEVRILRSRLRLLSSIV